MSAIKHLSKVLGLAALAAVVVGFASPASASPVPPAADPVLYGTWVNTNPASLSVKQIVVQPTRVGNVLVDAFGSCHPTLCEWGRVPAIVYGANVSSPSGATFQSRQRFLSGGVEWSRTTLLGKVTRTRTGPLLTLRELTVFEDSSGRSNYNVTESFKLGDGQQPTINGNSVTGYQRGAAPDVLAGALGSWTNPTPAGSLVAIKITGTPTHPVVQAFGQCSPTPCDWGRVQGITFGDSIASTTGDTMLVPYKFGFKNSQLVIKYTPTATGGGRLTVAEYNEFTDGSGRSNYALTENFVRS